ncbi:MAG: preprotein translocase subunit SecA [Phycisphaerales bacterium]|nr:preprotein translocase subunit SecA [Phycisphaerales bacterium]
MAQQHQGVPLVGPLLTLIFGTRNERFVRKYTERVERISAMEPQMRVLTDAQLRAKTVEFRERIEKGEKPYDLMDEAFAVAREAMDRAVGIRNIFNPRFAEQFDPSRLSADMRAVFERTKAELEARPAVPPEGEFMGGEEEIPGWRQGDLPLELYDAIRALYPESKPPFRSRPFDVQLIGAMVLYQGKIAEMKTGEGKTIVAPLAAYLAALERMRVHVVTVNDYLVQRDRDWTFPFFRHLGLTVGAIHPMHMQPEDVKRVMYRCDVVYGTTAEFGFDYLRDNMKRSADQQVQRARELAIVDEVDSILIDEARTPLIISGPAHDHAPRYDLADRLARHLVEKQRPWAEADAHVDRCKMRIKGLEGDIRNARDKAKIPEMQAELKKARAELPDLEGARDRFTQYYEVQMDRKQAHLTHHGVAEAQRVADIGSFYVGDNIDVPHLLEQSIRAHVVYQRDRDYVIMPVKDQATGRDQPSIVIVDVFTGRPMIGRQWSDGLHQAIEAKEQVPIKQETQTVATITIQNFFKMYQRLAGMTGTADTEAQEFHDIYKLDVVSIPTNLPVVRRDFNDTVYLTAGDKWGAVVDEIRAFHDLGRPVLVGTTSVEKSEKLSAELTRRHQVRHEVLNAKQHEREAHIIENAGQLGAVMIATNMAGRGTDIKLARITRDALLEHWLRRSLAPRELTTADSDERVRELVYRKIAPRELDMPKAEVEAMTPEQIELALLRHWCGKFTMESPGAIEKMGAEALRSALDASGRCALHRIGWADSVEGLGGLHVIGTERHESRRIDNQLRGRSGRQGDRGSSRFFVALDDELMKMFAGEMTLRLLSKLGMKEGDSIEHPLLTKSVAKAQRKVEERNFQVRKNILEYDEVMEHQRRSFYGLRQRVLEGREIRGLVVDYITAAVDDAVGKYLEPIYAAECAAEHARQTLDYPIPAERLKGLDQADMDERIRETAKIEARAVITLTIGEYIPEGAPPEDWDTKGLALWAVKQFGVEMTAAEVRERSLGDIERALIEAAAERIDAADLSGLARYASPDFGASELCAWARNMFAVEVKVEEIWGAPELAAGASDVIRERALAAYRSKEIEYPVDFIMEMTSAMMSQSPQQAMLNLVTWANNRFNLGWDENAMRTKMPQQIRDELLAASRGSIDSDRLGSLMQEALACADDAALDRFFVSRFSSPLPEALKKLHGQDREDKVRARVESMLRGEMARFEQFVFLEVFDSAWRDHLYAMDQLRDAIGYRAFSQQDPRIEYKREGSRLFKELQRTMRDRATEYLFKVRLVPQAAPQRPPVQPRPAPVAAGTGGSPAQPGAPRPFGFGSISGPGLDAPGSRP